MNPEYKYFRTKGKETPKEHAAIAESDEMLQEHKEIMVQGIIGIVDALHEPLQEKRYDTLYIDDSRARLHGLAFRKVMQSIYGDTKFNTHFIKGPRKMEMIPILVKHLEELENKAGNSALVITEEVASGKTLQNLLKAMETLNIETDLASFGITHPFTHTENGYVYHPQYDVNLDPEAYSLQPVGRGFNVHFPNVNFVLGVNNQAVLRSNSSSGVIGHSTYQPIVKKRSKDEFPMSIIEQYYTTTSQHIAAGRVFIQEIANETIERLKI